MVHSKNFTNSVETAVAVDRLGSLVRGENPNLTSYYPYGEQKGANSANPDKFATYFRDSYPGLDYAHNRYYSSTLARFTTPDPSKSGKTDNPGTWNRYSYVLNDPIELNDPSGLQAGCEQDCYMESATGRLTCFDRAGIFNDPFFQQFYARGAFPPFQPRRNVEVMEELVLYRHRVQLRVGVAASHRPSIPQTTRRTVTQHPIPVRRSRVGSNGTSVETRLKARWRTGWRLARQRER